ncbi:MAG: hypothetical protein ABIQ16_01490, partial [Polyangiaceae bacterium]
MNLAAKSLAGSASSTAATPPRWRLDAAFAQFFAWVGLGLLNQVLGAIRLPAPLPGVGTRHRVSDFGQFLMLGALSLLITALGAKALARLPGSPKLRPYRPALLVFAIVCCVSLVGVGPDVSNFAQRYELETWQVVLPLSIASGVAFASTLVLRRWAHGPLRAPLGLVALGIATSNAFVLDNDYFFIHFMLAWLSAISAAHAIEGLELPPLPRLARRVGAAVIAVIAVLSHALPVRNSDVQRRL